MWLKKFCIFVSWNESTGICFADKVHHTLTHPVSGI